MFVLGVFYFLLLLLAVASNGAAVVAGNNLSLCAFTAVTNSLVVVGFLLSKDIVDRNLGG